MKKQFQYIIIMLSFILSSMAWAQGQVDGGEWNDPSEINIHQRYQQDLTQDLEDISPLIFCEESFELCITLDGSIVFLSRQIGYPIFLQRPKKESTE